MYSTRLRLPVYNLTPFSALLSLLSFPTRAALYHPRLIPYDTTHLPS